VAPIDQLSWSARVRCGNLGLKEYIGQMNIGGPTVANKTFWERQSKKQDIFYESN